MFALTSERVVWMCGGYRNTCWMYRHGSGTRLMVTAPYVWLTSSWASWLRTASLPASLHSSPTWSSTARTRSVMWSYLGVIPCVAMSTCLIVNVKIKFCKIKSLACDAVILYILDSCSDQMNLIGRPIIALVLVTRSTLSLCPSRLLACDFLTLLSKILYLFCSIR